MKYSEAIKLRLNRYMVKEVGLELCYGCVFLVESHFSDPTATFTYTCIKSMEENGFTDPCSYETDREPIRCDEFKGIQTLTKEEILIMAKTVGAETDDLYEEAKKIGRLPGNCWNSPAPCFIKKLADRLSHIKTDNQ